MQRFLVPLILAVLIGVVVFAIQSFGGEDEPTLSIDLEPAAVSHGVESGLTIRVLNRSSNDFDGGVRIQVIQGASSVTKTLELEIPALGAADGVIDGDWEAGPEAAVIQIVLDPQADLNETDVSNNEIRVDCPLPEAACQLR